MALLYAIPAMRCRLNLSDPVDLGTELKDLVVEEIRELGFDLPAMAQAATLRFDAIGLDSMDMINLVVALEDRLDIEISVNSRIVCETINDLVAVLARQQK